jgi:hypothetical protein
MDVGRSPCNPSRASLERQVAPYWQVCDWFHELPGGNGGGRLRFGIVSCANLQAGWFSAYRHLAKRHDLDAVIHLGDYIYEYGPGEYGYGQGNVDVRPHDPPREMVTLADYRRRHAQYKRDRDLQKLHRRNPFIVTWDDHEVDNNYAGTRSESLDPNFRRRRAAAYQAYFEHMPLRERARPTSARMALRSRHNWGRLARFHVLDGRPAPDAGRPAACAAGGRRARGSAQGAPSCDASAAPCETVWGGQSCATACARSRPGTRPPCGARNPGPATPTADRHSRWRPRGRPM